MFEYDATAAFIIPPYQLFTVIGFVFATSLFMILLLEFTLGIYRYLQIFCSAAPDC